MYLTGAHSRSVHTPGACTLLVCVLFTITYTPGVCTLLERAHSWSVHTPSLCALHNNTHSRSVHTPGVYTSPEYVLTGVCTSVCTLLVSSAHFWSMHTLVYTPGQYTLLVGAHS